MAKTITIAGRKIGEGQPVFIIAEVSCNHQQNFDQAVAIIKAAKWAGADAVKLQTFTPDTITLPARTKWFFVDGKDNPDTWKGQTFHDLYQKAYMPWDWQPKLQKIAYELGLIFFSTPFDLTAVDFLETLHVPCYKIAAYESTDIPLLKKVAATGKPVIMSVGFATLAEIEYSVKILRDHGVHDLALLKCTTSYDDKERSGATNLRTMLDLRDRFDCAAGFSDNMGGIEAPVVAATMGGSIIEKHLLLRHDVAIFDDRFSLDKEAFKAMVDRIRVSEALIGAVSYGPQTPQEEHNKRFRRSLFVSRNMKKGERFTPENVRDVRPADGLETRYLDDVLGKTATKDIVAGTPLAWDLIK